MKSYQSHVRSDRIKWAFVALAFLAVAVILCAILTHGFTDWNPYCWFGHDFVNGDCTKCHAVQTTAMVNPAILR